MEFSLEKREIRSKKLVFILPIISIFISMLLGAIILLACNVNPIMTYYYLVRGALGNKINLLNTIGKAIPLLLCGIGVGVAFRLKFWNIGAEGQYVWGVIGITWVMLSGKWADLVAEGTYSNASWLMLFWAWVPDPLLLPIGILVGMLMGALWAGVPAWLKAHWKVDETLSTLMLNYVVIKLAEYLYISRWKAPLGNMGTPDIPEAGFLTSFGYGGKLNTGLFMALAVVGIMYFILYKTRWGFELNMIGKNSKAARCQGVSIKRNIVIALLVSGAICGLAGAIDTAGITHKLTKGVDSGYGFTGIVIAWMSGLNPIISIFYALLMAILRTGAFSLQIKMGLNSAMGDVLQGLILIPLLASNIFVDYRLVIKHYKKKIIDKVSCKEEE